MGTGCSGFSVLRCLGRARTLVAPTSRAIAASRSFFASPEKRACGNVFHHAISHPRHGCARRGLAPQKPSPDRGEVLATMTGLCQEANTRPGKVIPCCSRGRGGFFWPLAPPHASACEGVRRRRAMATARRAWCLALAAKRDPAQRSEAEHSRCPCPRGASAARTAKHRKNPE